jgi:hypothetical protein
VETRKPTGADRLARSLARSRVPFARDDDDDDDDDGHKWGML